MESRWGHKKCNTCWDNRARWKQQTVASSDPFAPPFDWSFQPTISLKDELKSHPDLLDQASKRADELLKQPQYSHIPKTSLMAIYLYTLESPIYSNLNKAMYTGEIQKGPWQCFAYHFIKGLDLLPDYQGYVYRGEKLSKDDDMILKPSKNSMWFNYFVSTSKDNMVAKGFGPWKYSKAKVFRIYIRTGKDISGISTFPSEQEVLLRPLFNYTITDSGWGKDGTPNCFDVHLQETDKQKTNDAVWWLKK
jgi:hypothetical protein